MIRYVKQNDRFRCGPVGVINALKWSNRKLSYKEWKPTLDYYMKCTSPNGTSCYDVVNFLTSFGEDILTVTTEKQFTLREVDKHLDSGGAVLFNLMFRQEGKIQGHLSLCVGRTKHRYKMINHFKDKTKTMIYRSTLNKNMRTLKHHHTALFLTKKDKIPG